ncbi:hypothetical protein C2E25_07665 [Geothermobacter hydrogeniphilus]|uniref:AXH domain-containing protein n=1 Tax=Geothermobacter hydrogeniphilus TaxID=1969733 RepID=A0A2K2HB12_9BACT|nr:hypothetical protein [Geothermobacter hydrogeniphilus]PNU20430.1 hypothetical protein C2E25_07665 [Geothermobacter hydrogeniphilus]
MHCPVCKSLEQEQKNLGLHAEGFYENITECRICGSSWSVNHGVAELISDPQEKSFLEGMSECVEGDDYGWAA